MPEEQNISQEKTMTTKELAATEEAKKNNMPEQGSEQTQTTLTPQGFPPKEDLAAAKSMSPEQAITPPQSSAPEQAMPLEKPKVSPFVGLNAGLRRKFELLYNSNCTSRLWGIPYFTPPISPYALFNLWSFFLGPLYYIFNDMWRKGLLLLLMYIIVPMAVGSFSQKLVSGEEVAIAYGTYYFVLFILTPACIACVAIGQQILSGLLLLAFAGTFLAGLQDAMSIDAHELQLYWQYVSLPLWHLLVSLIVLYTLNKSSWGRAIAFFITVLCLVFGLPLGTLPSVITTATLGIMVGLMGTYDRYRSLVLQQKFWW